MRPQRADVDADQDERSPDDQAGGDRLVVQPGGEQDGHDRRDDEPVRGARRAPEPDHDDVEHEHDPGADHHGVGEREPGRGALGQHHRLSDQQRERDEDQCARRHAERVLRHRVNRRKAPHQHRRLREAEHRAQARDQGYQRHRFTLGQARDQRHADEREERPSDRGAVQALLALGDGEQQRRQWDEREDRLSEAGVDADERVVGEGERAPEQQRAEDQRSDESPPRAGARRIAAITAASSRAARPKRRPAPQSGSSSRLLYRTPTALPPASTASARKAASATRSARSRIGQA